MVQSLRQRVTIAAGFGHEHRGTRRKGAIPPTAHIADCGVVVADMFGEFQVQDRADLPVEQSLFDLGIERRIAKNVADHDCAPAELRFVLKSLSLRRVGPRGARQARRTGQSAEL